MESGIYTIRNKINNKIYVGCTNNLEKRLKYHKWKLLNNKHANIHLQKAFLKYGMENFEFETLEECEEQFLYGQEHYWCIILNSHNSVYGYNIKPTNPYKIGGISPNTREKISNALRGKTHTNETKQKIAEKARNRKGHLISEEMREKLRIKATGRKHTEESKLKMRGREVSTSFREMQSFIHKGKIVPNEVREKIRSKLKGNIPVNRKVIYQYDTFGHFVKKWESIASAAKYLNLKAPLITKCAKGERKTTGGFVWKYLKDYV